MGDVFGKPAIVTDTHCIRLSNRIGLVHDMKDPKRWKWLSGRSSLRKKAMISATVLSIMEEKSVQRGQSLTVTAAVSMISAKKWDLNVCSSINLQTSERKNIMNFKNWK